MLRVCNVAMSRWVANGVRSAMSMRSKRRLCCSWPAVTYCMTRAFVDDSHRAGTVL